MKVLVTGAAGFIGSHLCEYLMAKDIHVVGIDNFADYYPRSMKENNLASLRENPDFKFVEASLLEINLNELVKNMDGVFHQAAQAGVRASWGDTFRIYTDTNILATQLLLEACRHERIQKFIYASSSSVYGDTTDLPMNEKSLPLPVSPYGVSKLAAEHLCGLYHRNFAIPTVSLRYFTVFGPRQRPDMAFHRFFKWALAGDPIVVFGDGRQSRDFTCVDDIVEANWLAFEKGSAGDVFNIGGGSRIALNEAIDIIKALVGGTIEVQYQNVAKGDVKHTSADMTRAREILGYHPTVSVEEGLRREYEWIRNQMFQSCQTGLD